MKDSRREKVHSHVNFKILQICTYDSLPNGTKSKQVVEERRKIIVSRGRIKSYMWIANDPTQRCRPNDAVMQKPPKIERELDRLSKFSIAHLSQRRHHYGEYIHENMIDSVAAATAPKTT
jgi:hypothetical protein